MHPLPPICSDEKRNSNADFRELVNCKIVDRLNESESVPVAKKRHVDSERDILDDALELLEATNNNVDGNIAAMAEQLMKQDDRDSMLKAHRLLCESGVQLGLWSLGQNPTSTKEATPQDTCVEKFNPIPAWDHGGKL
uniref:Uncharacterized protein n=1 Tax=Aureoumbra lagunensis TaxID=44058 RepID=A0A7S3NRM2_9STRA|mmetsp:Transcript_20803/g.26925  ORF Transcript_20803/g.26925 Transcript_20803/m.26925 type:complete len:138 (-) Transcript_20803:81-494(-)